MKNILLINYSGVNLTCNTFIPDNSLGILAAGLIQRGAHVRILDLQSPASVGEILDDTDPEIKREVWEKIESKKEPDPELFGKYLSSRQAAQTKFESRALEQILRIIERDKIHLVGFKLWLGNGLQGAVRMAEAIKEYCPSVRLVAGGPAIRYAEEHFLKKTKAFDYLFYSDAEMALDLLVDGECGATHGTIHGAWDDYQKSPPALVRNLDHIPAPLYEAGVYPDVQQFFRLRIIDESRGCFNRCSFCSHVQFSGVTRKKNPKLIVDEIEREHLENGVNHFRFAGSNPPWKHLLAIAEEIKNRGLRIYYSAFSSMNNVNPSDMGRMYESGLRGLFFGLEAGDPEFLKRVHNKNNLDQEHIVRVAHSAMGRGIFTCFSTIVPSPFESERTKAATFELISRAFSKHRHGSILVLPAMLTPGSHWWSEMERYGFQFNPGMSKEKYISNVLDFDPHFLFSRNVIEDLGYTLNGKTCAQLYQECQEFMDRVSAESIPTNVDDASYMISLLGGLTAEKYQSLIFKELVSGTSESIQSLVGTMNAKQAAPLRRGSPPPADLFPGLI